MYTACQANLMKTLSYWILSNYLIKIQEIAILIARFKIARESRVKSFRGHPGLAKYHTVWVTFRRYFLLDAFSLTCAVWIVSTYVSQCQGQFLSNHPNSFIVERIGFMLTESQNDHPSSIDL